MSNFYGTEIKIWAGFGPIGNTYKKIRQIMSNFWGHFFHDLKKNIVHTKKLHKMKVKKTFFLKN